MKLSKVKRVISAALGELPLTGDTATFKPTASKRDDHLGEVPENHGFTESSQTAELVMTLQATMDPSEFDLGQDTLTIYLDTGAIHQMPNGWVTDQTEIGKGELKVTYHCGKSLRIQ